jgi:hypothetical protein
MKRILRFSFEAALLAMLAQTVAQTVAQAAPIFSFDAAGGAIAGVPGGTAGWGFALSDLSEFLIVSETGFCPVTATQSDLPTGCSNAFLALGTYTDFSGAMPVVGPPPDISPLTQNFNGVTLSGGFGDFVIVPTAPQGTTSGEIAIIYDLFTGDPNTDPNATQIGGDTFIALPASITVNSLAEAVPEPGSMLLMGVMLSIGIASPSLTGLARSSRHGRRATSPS